MYEDTLQAITSVLTISLGYPVRATPFLSETLLSSAREAVFREDGRIAAFEFENDQYLCAAYDGIADEVIVVGPIGAEEPTAGQDQRRLSIGTAPKLYRALESAAEALRMMVDEPLLRLELSREMEMLSSAIVAISSELQLDAVLRRITDLARNFVAAKYAALGIPDRHGRLETFITAGLSEEEEARIDHRPEGIGLLGLLLRQSKPIRSSDLASHPSAVGFPEHHPQMQSFLGVPIISRSGEIIGSLYLTEKRFGEAFTPQDERLIELLARHAAVAIENARLYQRLEGQEQQLTLILEQLPEAVIIAEPDPPRLTVMNEQARRLLHMYGPLPFSIFEFDRVLELQDKSGCSITVAQTPLVRSLVHGEFVMREEVTATLKSGLKRTFLVNCAPMDQEGKPGGAICVFQDITEIRDADQIKDDFLSLVSHELRTPLTTIHGGSQLLLQQWNTLDAETRNELLHDINEESARLATLIQNMVQLTHIQAGRISLELEPVHVRILAERCMRQLRPLDPSREFNVAIPGNAVAMADANRLDEMLRNVIHNALKYTPAGTPIDVEGRVRADRVEIAVRDYGPGIPEHELASVFERFERGSRRAADSSGMGLGLYLVRLLVESQSGEVAIDLPKDGGTRVLFTLPRATEGD